MIKNNKVLVVDVDGTLCPAERGDMSYADLPAEPLLVQRLQELAAGGWHIIIHSSRNMRSYNGNTGAINARTLPVLLEWLARHEVPYHEIYMGKPWPGHDGFYIDDRAVRPREFLEHSHDELMTICERDRVAKPVVATR